MDLLMCLSLINFEWREWQDVINQLQQVSKVSYYSCATLFHLYFRYPTKLVRTGSVKCAGAIVASPKPMLLLKQG